MFKLEPASKKATKKDSEKVPEGIYEGTLRVVTEADVLADSRLVAAGAVVGQLYDFSNLPHVQDNAIEADVEAKNRLKAETVDEDGNLVAPVAPEFSSEAERRALGVKNPEEKPPRS